MPQPSNDWERTYEASIRREEEAARAQPGYAFHKFLIDLRGYLIVAGLVAGVAARWGFYWVAVGALIVAGAFTWWRHPKRSRR